MYFTEAIDTIKQLPVENGIGNAIVKDSWKMKKAIQYVPRGVEGLFFSFKISYFDIGNFYSKDKTSYKVFKPKEVSIEDLLSDDWKIYRGADIFKNFHKENCIE